MSVPEIVVSNIIIVLLPAITLSGHTRIKIFEIFLTKSVFVDIFFVAALQCFVENSLNRAQEKNIPGSGYAGKGLVGEKNAQNSMVYLD